ncbi:hypothetical protein [Daejeonella sp.]|uniref:hypothetical protein n=1 Tax=Daejeonella sp. TaxID=2805397 RepID=UPI0030C39B0F
MKKLIFVLLLIITAASSNAQIYYVQDMSTVQIKSTTKVFAKQGLDNVTLAICMHQ